MRAGERAEPTPKPNRTGPHQAGIERLGARTGVGAERAAEKVADRVHGHGRLAVLVGVVAWLRRRRAGQEEGRAGQGMVSA